jgi:hypothetical protein
MNSDQGRFEALFTDVSAIIYFYARVCARDKGDDECMIRIN